MFFIGLAAGVFVGLAVGLVWHWFTLVHWSARIREANGGKLPGYD
jgi:hypothetical protein